MKRFFAVLHARNLEFLRDRSALAWNIILPFFIVLGFAFAFSGGPRDMFKVGVYGGESAQTDAGDRPRAFDRFGRSHPDR